MLRMLPCIYTVLKARELLRSFLVWDEASTSPQPGSSHGWAVYLELLLRKLAKTKPRRTWLMLDNAQGFSTMGSSIDPLCLICKTFPIKFDHLRQNLQLHPSCFYKVCLTNGWNYNSMQKNFLILRWLWVQEIKIQSIYFFIVEKYDRKINKKPSSIKIHYIKIKFCGVNGL